jgi:hypothetical protein
MSYEEQDTCMYVRFNLLKMEGLCRPIVIELDRIYDINIKLSPMS